MTIRNVVGTFAVFLSVSVGPLPSTAQVLFSGDQLNQLDSRVAPYPAGLLAQALAASTYSDEIPEAPQWSDGHSYLHGDALPAAISGPGIIEILPTDPASYYVPIYHPRAERNGNPSNGRY